MRARSSNRFVARTVAAFSLFALFVAMTEVGLPPGWRYLAWVLVLAVAGVVRLYARNDRYTRRAIRIASRGEGREPPASYGA